ncbi:MAG: alpha/beta fold hydrolase [Archangium sp.]
MSAFRDRSVALVALATTVHLLASGCAFFRSSHEPLYASKLTSTGAGCVLVFLPGAGDSPELFETHGFLDAVKGSRANCDVLSVDAHFGYYRDAVFPQRLASDWLTSLRRRYDRVWLVGVSLGGYGAIQTAQAYPELVDGVVLISPFLGVPQGTAPLLTKIESSGGLEAFRSEAREPKNRRRHFLEVEPVWNWLAERSRGEPGPALIVASGSEDGFAAAQQTVVRALPSGSTFRAPGGHTWTTFAALWRQVVAAAPWAA